MAFSLSRNFWLRGPIWLFHTIFGICRPRAFILDHKKDLFKHFKGVKTAEAATADLIRVVLAEILKDWVEIPLEGSQMMKWKW